MSFRELYRAGRQLQSEKKFEEALPLLQQAADAEEKTSAALLALAQCFTELGRHQEAIDAAKLAVAKEPNDNLTYVQLSRAYQRGGFIPEAEYAMAQGQQIAWKAKGG